MEIGAKLTAAHLDKVICMSHINKNHVVFQSYFGLQLYNGSLSIVEHGGTFSSFKGLPNCQSRLIVHIVYLLLPVCEKSIDYCWAQKMNAFLVPQNLDKTKEIAEIAIFFEFLSFCKTGRRRF